MLPFAPIFRSRARATSRTGTFRLINLRSGMPIASDLRTSVAPFAHAILDRAVCVPNHGASAARANARFSNRARRAREFECFDASLQLRVLRDRYFSPMLRSGLGRRNLGVLLLRALLNDCWKPSPRPRSARFSRRILLEQVFQEPANLFRRLPCVGTRLEAAPHDVIWRRNILHVDRKSTRLNSS